MPPRSIWKGAIAFGMVSIPVRLFTATQDKDVSFHLLHQPDSSRIRFARVCVAEDHEVPSEELTRAYEVSKGQYVEITDEDLEQLPLPARHTIELSSFVDAADIDPIYYDTSYYLEPEEIGFKPYALLLKVLERKKAIGLASIAIRNKESLCALRVQDGGLLLETLHYPDEIREREVKRPEVLVSDRELDVAGSLVDALAGPFEPARYHDRYREALLQMIESKAAGREVVAPEGEPVAEVGDLMAALRASLEAARKGGPSRQAHSSPADDERTSDEDRKGRDDDDETRDEGDRTKKPRPAKKREQRSGAGGPAAGAAGAASRSSKSSRRRTAAA